MLNLTLNFDSILVRVEAPKWGGVGSREGCPLPSRLGGLYSSYSTSPPHTANLHIASCVVQWPIIIVLEIHSRSIDLTCFVCPSCLVLRTCSAVVVNLIRIQHVGVSSAETSLKICLLVYLVHNILFIHRLDFYISCLSISCRGTMQTVANGNS